jgi:hypothetical protein
MRRAQVSKATDNIDKTNLSGPVRIFISYSSEDKEIADKFGAMLERLSELSNGNIRVTQDKKSFEVGEPTPLIREISDKLIDTDYLILIYSGMMRKSISWTGTELGIFWRFIRSDIRDHDRS